MVGLTTWTMFFERTWLSLHGKRVVVVGYGLVGQGGGLSRAMWMSKVEWMLPKNDWTKRNRTNYSDYASSGMRGDWQSRNL